MSSTIAPPPRHTQTSPLQSQSSQDNLAVSPTRTERLSPPTLGSSSGSNGLPFLRRDPLDNLLHTPSTTLSQFQLVSSTSSPVTSSRRNSRVLPNPIQPPGFGQASTTAPSLHQRTTSLDGRQQGKLAKQSNGGANDEVDHMFIMHRMDNERLLKPSVSGAPFNLWSSDVKGGGVASKDRSTLVTTYDQHSNSHNRSTTNGKEGCDFLAVKQVYNALASPASTVSSSSGTLSYGSLDSGLHASIGTLSAVDNSTQRSGSSVYSVSSHGDTTKTNGANPISWDANQLLQDNNSLLTSQSTMSTSLHPHFAPTNLVPQPQHLYGTTTTSVSFQAQPISSSMVNNLDICALCRVQMTSVSLGACGHRVCSVCHRHEKHRSLRLCNSHAVICPFCSHGADMTLSQSIANQSKQQHQHLLDPALPLKDTLQQQKQLQYQEPTSMTLMGRSFSPQPTTTAQQQSLSSIAYPAGAFHMDLEGYPVNRQYHPTFPAYTPPYAPLVLRTSTVHEGMIHYDASSNSATPTGQTGVIYPRMQQHYQQQSQQQHFQHTDIHQQTQSVTKLSQHNSTQCSTVMLNPYWNFSRDPNLTALGRPGMISPPSGSWRESNQIVSDLSTMASGLYGGQQRQHGYDGHLTVAQGQRGFNSNKHGYSFQQQVQLGGESAATAGSLPNAMRGAELLASQLLIIPNLPAVAPVPGLRSESWKWAVIRISNIPWDVSLQDMLAFFAGFPMPPEHLLPQNVHILMDRGTGKTFNSAFIELALTAQQAGLVAQSRNLKVLKGRLVTVELSSQDELLRSIFPKWTGQFIQGEPVLHQDPDDSSLPSTAVASGASVVTPSSIAASKSNSSPPSILGGGGIGGINDSGRLLKNASGMEHADVGQHKAGYLRPLSVSIPSSTLASSNDSLSNYGGSQETGTRVPTLTPTPTPAATTLSQSTLFASNPATPPFVTRDEINALLVVCRNYKLHFSRKCAERPFENILSILTKYPWHQPHLVLPLHRDHIFELLKLSIESLRVHLSKDFHTIHHTLLERMVRCAILTPAFTERQKSMVLHVAGCPCPEDLLPWMVPHQPQQQIFPTPTAADSTITDPTSQVAIVQSTTSTVEPDTIAATTKSQAVAAANQSMERESTSADAAIVVTVCTDQHTGRSVIVGTADDESRTPPFSTQGGKDDVDKGTHKVSSNVESVVERLSVIEISGKASSKAPKDQPSFALANNNRSPISWVTIATPSDSKTLMVTTAPSIIPTPPVAFTDTDVSLHPSSVMLKSAVAARPQQAMGTAAPSYAAALVQSSSPSISVCTAVDTPSTANPSTIRGGSLFCSSSQHDGHHTTTTSAPMASSSSSSESLLWAIKNITQSTPRLHRSSSQPKRDQ